MHKDGLIFTAVTLIVFYFNKWLTRKRISFPSILVCIACAILIFALRNFVLLLLIPALLTWMLAERFPSRKIIATISVYGICVVLFFMMRYINSTLDFPAYIISKQNEFKSLGGNSQLQLPALEPSAASFLQFFPSAADIAFFRPHVTETENVAYLPSIAENILLYLLIIFALVKLAIRRDEQRPSSSAVSFILFCYCFAISCLLLSGYTVTLTGAVVRYRSFVLPFLIAPLAQFIHIRKKNMSEF